MSFTPECQAYIDTHLYENQDATTNRRIQHSLG